MMWAIHNKSRFGYCSFSDVLPRIPLPNATLAFDVKISQHVDESERFTERCPRAEIKIGIDAGMELRVLISDVEAAIYHKTLELCDRSVCH